MKTKAKKRPTERRRKVNFMVVLELDACFSFIDIEDRVISALAHSTAAEALGEALEGTVTLRLAEERDFN